MKTETKHTPGPWSDFITGNESQPCVIKNGAGGELIATVHTVIHPMEPTPRQETTEANAALIAAAPDLLQACRMILRWIEMENQDNPEIEDLTLSTVGEHVEAAIARAEGKEAAR